MAAESSFSSMAPSSADGGKMTVVGSLALSLERISLLANECFVIEVLSVEGCRGARSSLY